MLTPQQLELVSDEYYVKGFLHGRNRLYDHMRATYPDIFTSRDDIGEWLKFKKSINFSNIRKSLKWFHL